MQTQRAHLRGGLILGFYAVAGAGFALLVAAARAIWLPVGAPRRVDAQVEQTATAQNWRLASLSKQDQPTPELQERFRWLSGLVEPEWMQHYQQPGVVGRVLEWQEAGAAGNHIETLSFGYNGDGFSSAIVFVLHAGWPMACITGEFSMLAGRYRYFTSAADEVWSDIVPIPEALHPVQTIWTRRGSAPGAGGFGSKIGVLPTRIEPLGLAVNAVVFGAVLWVAVRIPRTLRRIYHRYRGACLACGCSRAGISEATRCPECGAASGSALPLP